MKDNYKDIGKKLLLDYQSYFFIYWLLLKNNKIKKFLFENKNFGLLNNNIENLYSIILFPEPFVKLLINDIGIPLIKKMTQNYEFKDKDMKKIFNLYEFSDENKIDLQF